MRVDAEKVDKLKVWYACFMTILDTPTWPDKLKMHKMRELAKQIDLEIPKPQ